VSGRDFIRTTAPPDWLLKTWRGDKQPRGRHPDAHRDEPQFEALLAFLDDEPAGLGLFHPRFSTWLGRPGVYLEDLFMTCMGAFPVKRVVLGSADSFLFGAGKAVFVPSPG
jgi:hypothetical protein